MVSCEPTVGIPVPIVKLNRWLLVIGLIAGLLTGQPLVTTLLFLLLLPAVVIGRQASPVFLAGRRLLARQIEHARQRGEVEDPGLMRFNNTIALILLGLAQIAFLAGYPIVGWILALVVVAAASVALAGFCLGCFLYYQFRLNRHRLSGR